MIQRYLHYFDRFMNHKKSRELESKLRENTLSKMEKMQEEGNKTWIDVQFMKQATSQLIEARQLLQVGLELLCRRTSRICSVFVTPSCSMGSIALPEIDDGLCSGWLLIFF